VTLAAFVGVMVSFAALVPYTFSLDLAPLQAEFGWKREAISRAFAITALTVAACSPTIGTLLDRTAPRKVILPCIIVFACGIASLSLLRGNIAQFYGTYLLIGIVGNGTAQLAYSRAVLTWFEQRRGLALAVVLTGSGTGSILLPIIAQRVMAAHGWRASYVVLGAIALLGFPLTALLVRNRSTAFVARQTEAPVRISSVLRSYIFWLIALPVMLGAFSMNAVIAHLSALLTDHSIGASGAVLALSMLGVSGIVGRLITGYLLDRLFAPFRVSRSALHLRRRHCDHRLCDEHGRRDTRRFSDGIRRWKRGRCCSISDREVFRPCTVLDALRAQLDSLCGWRRYRTCHVRPCLR
jgi:MFS family permease